MDGHSLQSFQITAAIVAPNGTGAFSRFTALSSIDLITSGDDCIALERQPGS